MPTVVRKHIQKKSTTLLFEHKASHFGPEKSFMPTYGTDELTYTTKEKESIHKMGLNWTNPMHGYKPPKPTGNKNPFQKLGTNSIPPRKYDTNSIPGKVNPIYVNKTTASNFIKNN